MKVKATKKVLAVGIGQLRGKNSGAAAEVLEE